MDAMSYHHFKQHLKDHLKQVNEDAIPLVVTFKNPDDNVVVMSKRILTLPKKPCICLVTRN